MGTKASKPVEAEPPKLGKSGKKICCSCPETKKVRCVVGARGLCDEEMRMTG
jgi:hypothetical protein